MKKEAARDYVIEIFRKYAAAGYPTYEQERDRIYRDAMNSCAAFGTDTAVEMAETAVEKQASYLADIAAADGTFKLLNAGGRDTVVNAVRAVYCMAPLRPLHRGDITNRVNRFAVTCPVSDRNIYLWLKYARLLCASLRGLSISDRDRYKYRIDEKVCSSATERNDIMKA